MLIRALLCLLTPALAAHARAQAPADMPAPMKPAAQGTDDAPETFPELARFTIREGYEVSVAMNRLDGARFMEIGPDGTLYISRPRSEDIVECRDFDNDGRYESFRPLVEQHRQVHAMQWHDGWLWFSTSTQIWKTRATGEGTRDVITVLEGLPGGDGHWWRSLLVTDEHIYTSVGDSGNIEDETGTDRQKVWRYSLTGGDKTLWCSGIRNTEKLRLRPGTQEIWGTDHGSDWFGLPYGENDEKGQWITDLNPPDELNRYEQGKFYGHPFITGNRVPRLEYKDRKDIVELAAKTVAPQWCFGAHWAANSFTFIDPVVNAAAPNPMPKSHEGDMFVACRGSWNRSERAGYQVARVMFEKDKHFGGRPVGLETIVSTLAKNAAGEDEVLARPVDCLQTPDGSILFTSDAPVGRVYRIRWKGVGGASR
jgi:glucose/arabinose dehydrogenase